ncbi:bacillithiol biosynthesis cysteine-adding enzyme BshC [Radiobacillus sp. PE A8.2]|uniref:bacillithiol biosynthesis cysteine-adding enzyme BshC n=1 Tax=Radiobacillus sp. PE A8.2 TaxID=3380349 RepID=UPI003890A566
MWIESIQLNTFNRLISDYRNQNDLILNKFDYPPYDENSFPKRLAELNERDFQREALSNLLLQVNREWNAPESTLHNIERIQDSRSVVVIGGQQAGLLTGPLYTIHKIVSIIQLAKAKEAQLGIPVIPVFWIAGEDHDFDEINHIMLEMQSRMKKFKTLQRVHSKMSMSDFFIDKDITRQWMERVFEQLNETQHTASIHEKFSKIIETSDTFVDFFANLIFYLFDQEGLVLVDSGDKRLRKLESSYFKQMIEHQPAISEGVYKSSQQVKQSGYNISLEVLPEEGHLFYHLDGARVLLTKDEEGNWVGKQNECVFTSEELLDIASNHPELLSNNVVTRPIMQDLVFPTLAFLGGPGEVGYWSILKPGFHALNLKMPPVLPRLSLTIINRNVEKSLHKYGLDPSQVVCDGVDLQRSQWLANQTTPPIERLADQVKLSIERAHLPMKQLAKDLRPDLGEVAEKNLIYLFRDVDFLQDKLLQALEEKHGKALSEFDTLSVMMRPEGGLQERYWNILPFINQYGKDIVKGILDQSYAFDQEHYLLYI